MTTENWTFADYRLGDTVLPEPNLGWNMYGTGLESMGENGSPEEIGGTAVFIGAGGPMGQMHIQRAFESDHGPATIIGVDPDGIRLAVLEASLRPLADKLLFENYRVTSAP